MLERGETYDSAELNIRLVAGFFAFQTAHAAQFDPGGSQDGSECGINLYTQLI